MEGCPSSRTIAVLRGRLGGRPPDHRKRRLGAARTPPRRTRTPAFRAPRHQPVLPADARAGDPAAWHRRGTSTTRETVPSPRGPHDRRRRDDRRGRRRPPARRELAEKTRDWYATDQDGNVWYFGEDTATYDENGDLESREGSWEAGVDGAVAGIIMPADPRPSTAAYMEFAKGEAEDQAWVVQRLPSVRTPGGTYDQHRAHPRVEPAGARRGVDEVLRARARDRRGAGHRRAATSTSGWWPPPAVEEGRVRRH